MDTFIIHMAGKTGSQTIEQTVRASAPGSIIERHHFFSAKTINELRATCALRDAVSENAISVLSQCAQADRCRDTIVADWKRPKTIISAYRDPFRQSVAAMFQNLATFIPEYDSRLPAEYWIDRLVDQFSYVFRERNILTDSPKFIDRRRVRPVIGFTQWFETDFNLVHNVDVYEHEIDEIGTVRFDNEHTSYLIYKTEALEENFDRIVSAIPGIVSVRRIDSNRSADKPYGDLYRLFLETFSLTDEMFSHYYDNSFYKHFYD